MPTVSAQFRAVQEAQPGVCGCVGPTEPPCEPTWLNLTGRHLIAGGDIHPQPLTSDQCGQLCAYDMPDCVAVQYYPDSGQCVVHIDAEDLNNMRPSTDSDVYIVVKCNTTGKPSLKLHLSRLTSLRFYVSAVSSGGKCSTPSKQGS